MTYLGRPAASRTRYLMLVMVLPSWLDPSMVPALRNLRRSPDWGGRSPPGAGLLAPSVALVLGLAGLAGLEVLPLLEGLDDGLGLLALDGARELVVPTLPDPGPLAAEVATEGVLVDAGKFCELCGCEGLAGRGYGNPPFPVSL